METKSDLKCYNCGKVFRDLCDYNRHKNRKTPCLIREVEPEQKANPNMCIFCNRVLAKKGNLDRHLKTCKIRNGGMEILSEKIAYEKAKEVQEKAIKYDELQKKFTNMEKRMEIMENMIQTGALVMAAPQNTTINNTNYGAINNGTINNNTNNFNIHPLVNPCIDNIQVTVADLDNVEDINKWLFKTIYYNPNIPENFSLYLINDKEHKFLYRENNEWRYANSQEEVNIMLTKITNVLVIKGGDLINGKNGPYEENSNKFLSLPQKIQNLIESFNDSKNYRDKDRLSLDAVKEIALPGRALIKPYIKKLGALV